MKKLTLEEVSEKHVGFHHECLNAPVEGCYSITNVGIVAYRDGKYLCDTGRISTDFMGNKVREALMIVTHVLIWK